MKCQELMKNKRTENYGLIFTQGAQTKPPREGAIERDLNNVSPKNI